MLLIRLHGQSNGVNEMFWDFGYFLLAGWSRARGSCPLARVLAAARRHLLVVLAVTEFLAPAYSDVLFHVFQPAFFAELAIMLWLLIVGAKENALTADAGAS